MHHPRYTALVLAFILVQPACTAVHTPPLSPAAANPTDSVARAVPPADSADLPKHAAIGEDPVVNEQRLVQLAERRRNSITKGDYPIGPGDVLLINVAGLDEFTGRTVRVTGDGVIVLPLLGPVQVSGLNEQSLAILLSKKLTDYVREPEVSIFVQEYRSRSVGVFGAVAKPGVYNLAGSADTLSDMLQLAGGTTPDASGQLQWIPAPSSHNDPSDSSSTFELGPRLTSKELASRASDTVWIYLNNPSSQQYLSLPARPGDIIVVPANGQVLVEGWVANPGSYKITPGLGALGAVAAAGGLSFAADSNKVTIIRNSRSGSPLPIPVDIQKVKRGEADDVAVVEGDVVDVGSSSAKLVPYGIYVLFAQMLRVGAYVNPATL